MGFVNEYVPEADIEKYDLRGIWDKYHPLKKGRYYGGNQPEWTIDREINVFLMLLDIGRGAHGNRKKFLLWWDGDHIVTELDLVDGSSGDLDANPFMRVWNLVRVILPSSLKEKRELVLRLLKEAVTVYGYRGVRKQLPNTVVEFKF
jgi:hypothetical protein